MADPWSETDAWPGPGSIGPASDRRLRRSSSPLAGQPGPDQPGAGRDRGVLARSRRPRLGVVLGVLLAVLGLLGTATPAYAAEPETDDEGGSLSLREQLEKIATGYYDAKAKLEASQKIKDKLTAELRDANLHLARLRLEVGRIAAGRYQSAQVSPLTSLLTGNADRAAMLHGAALSEYLLWRDDEALRRYRVVRDASEQQQAELDAQMEIEKQALAELDAQKRAAEAALAEYGGMVDLVYPGEIPAAQPAPRNPDGSWPKESCTIDDPTRSGSDACLTPRMYHTLNEARLAGFQRTTGCWRWQSWGEHPKGRACDFMATSGGQAYGTDKEYGDRLAAWGIENANALGIMYIIWYERIWMPNTGWRAYSGCCDPSSRHTNHVHISML